MRLKERMAYRFQFSPLLFQFHIGAIKSPTGIIRQGLYLRFNSILVRLKALDYIRVNAKHESFNSILVRLKDFETPYTDYPHMRFNSILVRLKALWHNIHRPRMAVSIPYWCD